MGVDIMYFCDNNLIFSTITDLRFSISRSLNSKVSIICYSKYYEIVENENCELIKHLPNETAQKENSEYFLKILDMDALINNFDTQDIRELIKNHKISIQLSDNGKLDFEIDISLTSVQMFCGSLAFDYRWMSFVTEIKKQEDSFLQSFYHHLSGINILAQVFNSKYLLLIGDGCYKVWADIEKKIDEGNTILDSLNINHTINLITSKMFLNKENLDQIGGVEREIQDVFLFSFKDFFPFYKPCKLAEFILPEEIRTYDRVVETFEVCIKTEHNDDPNVETCKKVFFSKKNYWTTYVVSMNSNDTILSEKYVYIGDNEINQFIKRTESFDYNAFHKNYHNPKTQEYTFSISYWKESFSFSISSWCPTTGYNDKKEFTDLIDDIFALVEEKETQGISIGPFRILGISLKRT